MQEQHEIETLAAAFCEEDPQIDESIKVKWVVRNGKKIKKFKSTKAPRYKIQIDKDTGRPKEVRITAAERRKRRLGQKTGKLLRKSKQNVIEKKRARSFVGRTNAGLAKYNKSNPDINSNREHRSNSIVHKADMSDVINVAWPSKVMPKLIHPMKKTIGESVLNEGPWVMFNDNVGWDFCEEAAWNDGSWLEQLVAIFNNDVLYSLRDDRNQRYPDGLDLELMNVPMADRIDVIINDMFFKMYARQAFKRLDDEDKDYLKKELPRKVYDCISRG